MMNYQWVLFDADNTLFNFDDFQILQKTFTQFNIEFTQSHFKEYSKLNQSLWDGYQNGTITLNDITQKRFSPWSGKSKSLTPEALNGVFLTTMAEISTPLEGARNLLNTLKDKVKLGIITNGFTQMQQVRLERTGFTQYFDLVIASEEVGVAKPNRIIFDYARGKMINNPNPEQILMVGDNPDSDILGGINAGFDTCWLNHENKPTPQHITPKYQVSSLSELENLFLNS